MSFPGAMGTAIDGQEVEEALLAFLLRWIGAPGFTYLAWAKSVKDPTDAIWAPKPGNADPAQEAFGFASVRTYSVKHLANEKWPEDQLPMYLAYARGLAEPRGSEGDGNLSGRFAVVLTAISSGFDDADAKRLARLYATAARGALLQHPGLASDLHPDGFGGPAPDQGGAVWADHSNFEITRGVEAERSLMGVSDTYLIPVGSMLNFNLGVSEPFTDPTTVPPDPPVVAEGGGQAVVGRLDESGFFNP